MANNNTNFWPIVLIVIGIAALLQVFSINSANTTATTPTTSNTFEYRYAKERFRQEGFSSADADTAAKAVIKFHEAQKR